jgi:alanine dehydrogenase
MCELVRKGLDAACSKLPALRRGVATHDGKVVNPALAAHVGLQEGTQ